MTTHHNLIPFHGDRLLLIDVEGEPFVALKPIAERLDLAWQPQHRKLNGDKSLWLHHLMVTETPAGPRESVVLPLRMLPAWLFSISPGKVDPACREALILYRRECADVLWRHWAGQHRKEVEALRGQVAKLRAFALAFNPLWAKIAALQKAGVASNQVRYHVGRTIFDAHSQIRAMEQVGVVDAEAWVDAMEAAAEAEAERLAAAASPGQGSLFGGEGGAA